MKSLATPHMAFFCLKFNVMKKSGTMGIMSAIGEWLDAESVSFTALCGERFSHREVLMTMLGIAALIVAIGVAGGVS